MRVAGISAVLALATCLVVGLAPAAARADCASIVEAGCLKTSTLGAGSTSAGGAVASAAPTCEMQWKAYRVCIAAAAGAAPTPTGSAAAGCDAATAQALWASAERADDCVGYESYRAACPDTPQARMAQGFLERLGCGDAARATASIPADPATDGAAVARAIQAELKRLGHYRGAVDGAFGRGSRTALEAFQRERGLAVDGAPSPAVLATLRAAEPMASQTAPRPTTRAPDPTPLAEPVPEPLPAPAPVARAVTPADLDRLCVQPAEARQRTEQCLDHIYARFDGLLSAFFGAVVGGWTATGDCSQAVDIRVIGGRVITTQFGMVVNQVDVASGLAASRAQLSAQPPEQWGLMSLSPTHVGADDGVMTAQRVIMNGEVYSILSPTQLDWNGVPLLRCY